MNLLLDAISAHEAWLDSGFLPGALILVVIVVAAALIIKRKKK